MSQFNQIIYKNHIQDNSSLIEFSTEKLINSEIELVLDWHEHVEIIYILEGEGVFNIAGRKTLVRSNSFIIINPNQVHSGQAILGRPLTYQSLRFKYDFFSSNTNDAIYETYISPLDKGKFFLPSTILPTFPIHGKVISIFEFLSHAFTDQKYGYEFLIKSYMYQLFHLFFSNKFIYTHPNHQTNQSEIIVKNTIEHIHDNYQDTLSLDFLSKLFNTSKPHLCRTFKRVTTQTISEYHNSYRIKKACELLLSTNDRIDTIAFKVGYNNISYFNERFKLKTHLTPIEFKQTHIKHFNK